MGWVLHSPGLLQPKALNSSLNMGIFSEFNCFPSQLHYTNKGNPTGFVGASDVATKYYHRRALNLFAQGPPQKPYSTSSESQSSTSLTLKHPTSTLEPQAPCKAQRPSVNPNPKKAHSTRQKSLAGALTTPDSPEKSQTAEDIPAVGLTPSKRSLNVRSSRGLLCYLRALMVQRGF